jgi:hypothetical protein
MVNKKSTEMSRARSEPGVNIRPAHKTTRPQKLTITFTELVDLVLAILYDRERWAIGEGKTSPISYLDLDRIVGDLKVRIPRDWMSDVGKVLESRGLADCIYTFGGGCQAKITGQGRLLVEESKQKYDELVDKLFDEYLLEEAVAGPSIPRTLQEERKAAFDVLKQIKRSLRKDTTISPEQRRDLLNNVGIIEVQLNRLEPNRPLIASVLQPLSDLQTIAPAVRTLVKLFNLS